MGRQLRRCHKEEAYSKHGNYIKRKAIAITIAIKQKVVEGKEDIKCEDEAEVPPESMKNTNDNNGVEIDVIVNFVKFSVAAATAPTPPPY